MTKRHHVLFAIPELDAAGPDRVFYELIKALDRSFFLPQLVVCRKGGRYFSQLPEDVEAFVIGGGRYPVWQFARAMDRLQPDLVLTTLRMNAVAAAAYFLQRHRPALIARPASSITLTFSELRTKTFIKHRIAELLIKRLLRVPQMLIAQSTDMQEELARIVGSSLNIAVIGNPVSVAGIETISSREQPFTHTQVGGSPSLIAVGRLAYEKGFDLLLLAFARFLREYPQARLTIFGEGPERAALEQQARLLGITHALSMPGHVEEVIEAIAAADIFVCSSRHDAFSNALLEAMALARPVVATNSHGATKDLVIHGKTGILVTDAEASVLLDGLLCAMTIDRSRLGQDAKNHVLERYGIERIATAYARLFRGMLESGNKLSAGEVT